MVWIGLEEDGPLVLYSWCSDEGSVFRLFFVAQFKEGILDHNPQK